MDNTIYENMIMHLRKNNQEEAFKVFSQTYGFDLNNKEKVLYDDMVLLLFSLIMNLDDEYMSITRNIRLDKYSAYYGFNQEKDKIIKSIFGRNFKRALYSLIDLKPRGENFTTKDAILLELLNLNIRHENKYNKYMLDLINSKDYDSAITYLSAKRNIRGLSIQERSLLYVLKDLKRVEAKEKLPEKREVESKSVLYSITNHNYHEALYMQEKICNARNIKPNNNTLFVAIRNICNIIDTLDETQKVQFTEFEKLDDDIIDSHNTINNQKILTKSKNNTIYRKKEADQFLY